jgi:hypothetical protein
MSRIGSKQGGTKSRFSPEAHQPAGHSALEDARERAMPAGLVATVGEPIALA